jgi:hypothetical protein
VTPADELDREHALEVVCPLIPCAADVGEPCVNLRSREPLAHLPAHDARLRAAGVRHAPIPTHELRDPDARRGGRW